MKVQMMLLVAAMEALAFGIPVRFEDPQAGRPIIACGVETRGEADGGPVASWKTTTLPDGWTSLSSGAETASVLVLNGAAVEGGRLTADATWTGAKVHVVRHDVIIPSGVTLTLEGGVIIKFLPNVRIWIEQGGKLLAEGVQFADFRDDSIGGDTNFDGEESLPEGTDWWFDDPGSEGIAEWRRPSNACESLVENGLVQVEFAGEGVEVPMVRMWTGGVEFGKGLPVPPYRNGFVFAGWKDAAGSVLTAESEVPNVDSSYEAVWNEVPTYGPWGEAEVVKNPDKLGPTLLTDMTLELNGAAGAVGDVVAAFRGDTGALCGLCKAMDDSGTLTMACYAPTGVKLHFKVWVAASGVEVPVVLDCDAKSDLTAPTSGAFLAGHALVVSGEKDLTISLRSADWHTVSFNVLPEDPSPAAVFGSVKDEIAAVTQGIEFWMPGKSSSLKSIQIGKGYWVNTKVNDVEWTVSGKTDPRAEISLEEGWNLIGYTPETDGAVQVVLKTALAEKAIDYVTYGVEFYPGGTLKKMEPGKAYWVHAKKAYTLVYDEAKEALKSSSFCGDRNVAVPLGATVPTYGPWGENEAVKNPDKLGPTFLIDVAVEIDGEPAACGDVVAVFRGDTGALCGLGKVLDGSGTMTAVCYAPKDVTLNFNVWLAESGVEEPVIVKCNDASLLVAPDVGAFYEGHAISCSTVNEYTVKFNANGGSGSMDDQTFLIGVSQQIAKCAFTRSGYRFAGWATTCGGSVVYSDRQSVQDLSTDSGATVVLYALWEEIPDEPEPPPVEPPEDPEQPEEPVIAPVVTNTVTYLNLQGAANSNPAQFTTNDLPLVLGAVEREGYTFLGWTPNGGVIPAGTVTNVTFAANWEKDDRSQTVVGEAETHVDVEKGEMAPFEDAAAVYDGFLYDGEKVVGSVQVKVAKGKVDKKSGAFSAKVTATVQLAGQAKKLSFKGGSADQSGTVTRMSAAGHELDVTVGVKGLGGTFDGKYKIDGARNVFSGKSTADKDAAGDAVRLYQGVYNVAFDGGTLSVSVDKKGKAKITGTVEGNKVSATSQLVVGKDAAVVPVVIVKKVNLSFCLWVMANGTVEARGIEGAIADRPSTLKAGAKFGVDGATGVRALPELYGEYLPNGIDVAASGTKWTVAGGVKAGKVAFVKGGNTVDESKLGMNPSGLKLTYKQKDGTFKGSFKAYNLESNGKIKAYTANVTGVMIDTKGYGTATIKKPFVSFSITIE